MTNASKPGDGGPTDDVAARDFGPQDGPDDGLLTYRDKRSADKTAEPFGGPVDPAPAAVGKPRLFVVQKHAARRLHWDLRLEIRGVLRSWAVPRGPCPNPAVKRLAVETEDHPLEYIDFEGVIPEGNYGAGEMIVWDRGVWIPLEPVDEGYKKGKLLFEMRGHKLRGVWTLVRTKEADGRQWLLIKKPDAAASDQEHPYDETSILSGLSIEDLRGGTRRAEAVRQRLEGLGAPGGEVDPRALALMLAEVHPDAFSDPAWLFELKYDGYRLVGARRDDEAVLRYRSGRDATDAFPEIERTLRALPFARFVLDGEVCVLDDDARPNFQRLQKRAMLLRSRDIERAMREHPVTYYAFDLLAFEDFDMRTLPLVQRKALLRELLPTIGFVRYTDHIPELGEQLMNSVRQLGVEGIVAKRSDSKYVAGRSPHWKKIRIEQTDDFVIVGFTLPERTRVGLGALHLAAYRGDALVYVGRVGTGFDTATLGRLRTVLDPLAREHPATTEPIAVPASSRARHVWVEPSLVAEIRYKHLTDGHALRHPVFCRLRHDKPPTQCVLPVDPANSPTGAHALEPSPGPSEPPAVSEPEVAAARKSIVRDPGPPTPQTGPRRVVVSNPDKVFWPEHGYTKLDLVQYYRTIAPWLLPYLRDRPLVLTRYPDGIEGKNFFQKNAPPYIPDWLRTRTMWSEHAKREIEYFVCDEVDALAYVANLATIPLHVWGSRLSDLQHPDWCILDLDPKGAPFADVVAIARHIHELCEEIELPGFLKTSGSTGLHVLIPLGRQFTFEQCRMFAEVLARVTATALRDIATVERHVPKRKGKVYIDFLQNGHGRLLVSPLCVRPLPGAPVSTPLAWDELSESMNQHDFTIRNVAARMASRDDPMLGVLSQAPDLQAALAKLLEKMEAS